MAHGTVEVVQIDGAWRVQVDREYTLSARYETQRQAVRAGDDLARERGVRLTVEAPTA
jgi:hypothetical protein